MRFDTLLSMADKLMLYKYVVKNVARAHGLTATFMPKPLFQDNGSGMHTHQSLWKGGDPLFYDEAGLCGSVGHGPLVHRRPPAPRRGHPCLRGADDELVQAARARLRGAREPRLLPAQSFGGVPHPALLEEPEGQAGGVPLPRPVVQPVPGVLGDAHGRPRRRAEPHRAARRRSTRTSTTCRPKSWPWCRRCPARSRSRSTRWRPTTKFLQAGGVFTDDLIETWIEYKRINEIDAIRLRPHPYEFDALLRHLIRGRGARGADRSPKPGAGLVCRRAAPVDSFPSNGSLSTRSATAQHRRRGAPWSTRWCRAACPDRSRLARGPELLVGGAFCWGNMYLRNHTVLTERPSAPSSDLAGRVERMARTLWSWRIRCSFAC